MLDWGRTSKSPLRSASLVSNERTARWQLHFFNLLPTHAPTGGGWGGRASRWLEMIIFETGLVFTSKYDVPAHKTEYIVFNLEVRGDISYIWFIWKPFNNETAFETNCAPHYQMQQFFSSGEYTLKKIPQNASKS